MRLLSFLLIIATGSAAYDTSSPFDPEFSRNTMFPLTAAAYADDPRACLNTVSKKFNLLHSNATSCAFLLDITCAGFVAELHDKNAVVISFRGTQGKPQLLKQALKTFVSGPVKLESGGAVGPYFKDAFDSVWNGWMETAMVSLASQNEGKELWITGHSLGGSMASIAAATIVHKGLWPVDKIRLMTYGEPRTGNKEYAQFMNSNILAMHRVVHRHDVVTHVPYQKWKYEHSRQKIFYHNDMSNITDFVACDGNDDVVCTDACTDNESTWAHWYMSTDDHINYYGVWISGWGKQGCTGPTKMMHLSSPELRAFELEVQREVNEYAMRKRFRARLQDSF